MDRGRAAAALLALAACVVCSNAAPTINDQTSLGIPEEPSNGCYYNFQHYGEGDRIMTNEPCLNCTCHNRMLMCYLRVCPFTKPIGQDCTIEKRADQCCPIVTCPDVPVDLLTSTSTISPAEYGATGLGKLDKYGCSINGKYFPEGSKVPPSPNKPCEHCYCIRNMTTCVMQECTLHVDGCTPIYLKDVCCPVRYSCDHTEDEIPLLDDMTTTVRPTPGFLLTTTTTLPVTQTTQDCVHDDQIFADGALIKTEKACEHCYCMKGDIVCVVQECGTPMENEGKNCTSLPPRQGQCCPDTYICEGDELSTETTINVQEVTTVPPRRMAVEGSGYRNEPDEPYTEIPPFGNEGEGSGEDLLSVPITETPVFEKEKPVTEIPKITNILPQLFTEPDRGQNTVPDTPYKDAETYKDKITTDVSVDTGEIDKMLNPTDTNLLISEQTTSSTFDISSQENVITITQSSIAEQDVTSKIEKTTKAEYTLDEATLKEDNLIAEKVSTPFEHEYKSTTQKTENIMTTLITPLQEATTSAIPDKSEPIGTNKYEVDIHTTVYEFDSYAYTTPNEKVDISDTTPANPVENEIHESVLPISSPGRIPGEGDCLLNGVTYENNSIVPSTNNCHSSCNCLSSIIKCDPIICSPPPEYMNDCQPIYDSPESCCPTYVCSTKETIPPESHNQMSDIDRNKPIAASECSSSDCTIPEINKQSIPLECSGSECSNKDVACTGETDCKHNIETVPCVNNDCKNKLDTDHQPPIKCDENGCSSEIKCTGNNCENVHGNKCSEPGCNVDASISINEVPNEQPLQEPSTTFEGTKEHISQETTEIPKISTIYVDEIINNKQSLTSTESSNVYITVPGKVTTDSAVIEDITQTESPQVNEIATIKTNSADMPEEPITRIENGMTTNLPLIETEPTAGKDQLVTETSYPHESSYDNLHPHIVTEQTILHESEQPITDSKVYSDITTQTNEIQSEEPIFTNEYITSTKSNEVITKEITISEVGYTTQKINVPIEDKGIETTEVVPTVINVIEDVKDEKHKDTTTHELEQQSTSHPLETHPTSSYATTSEITKIIGSQETSKPYEFNEPNEVTSSSIGGIKDIITESVTIATTEIIPKLTDATPISHSIDHKPEETNINLPLDSLTDSPKLDQEISGITENDVLNNNIQQETQKIEEPIESSTLKYHEYTTESKYVDTKPIDSVDVTVVDVDKSILSTTTKDQDGIKITTEIPTTEDKDRKDEFSITKSPVQEETLNTNSPVPISTTLPEIYQTEAKEPEIKDGVTDKQLGTVEHSTKPVLEVSTTTPLMTEKDHEFDTTTSLFSDMTTRQSDVVQETPSKKKDEEVEETSTKITETEPFTLHTTSKNLDLNQGNVTEETYSKKTTQILGDITTQMPHEKDNEYLPITTTTNFDRYGVSEMEITTSQISQYEKHDFELPMSTIRIQDLDVNPTESTRPGAVVGSQKPLTAPGIISNTEKFDGMEVTTKVTSEEDQSLIQTTKSQPYVTELSPEEVEISTKSDTNIFVNQDLTTENVNLINVSHDVTSEKSNILGDLDINGDKITTPVSEIDASKPKDVTTKTPELYTIPVITSIPEIYTTQSNEKDHTTVFIPVSKEQSIATTEIEHVTSSKTDVTLETSTPNNEALEPHKDLQDQSFIINDNDVPSTLGSETVAPKINEGITEKIMPPTVSTSFNEIPDSTTLETITEKEYNKQTPLFVSEVTTKKQSDVLHETSTTVETESSTITKGTMFEMGNTDSSIIDSDTLNTVRPEIQHQEQSTISDMFEHDDNKNKYQHTTPSFMHQEITDVTLSLVTDRQETIDKDAEPKISTNEPYIHTSEFTGMEPGSSPIPDLSISSSESPNMATEVIETDKKSTYDVKESSTEYTKLDEQPEYITERPKLTILPVSEDNLMIENDDTRRVINNTELSTSYNLYETTTTVLHDKQTEQIDVKPVTSQSMPDLSSHETNKPTSFNKDSERNTETSLVSNDLPSSANLYKPTTSMHFEDKTETEIEDKLITEAITTQNLYESTSSGYITEKETENAAEIQSETKETTPMHILYETTTLTFAEKEKEIETQEITKKPIYIQEEYETTTSSVLEKETDMAVGIQLVTKEPINTQDLGKTTESETINKGDENKIENDLLTKEPVHSTEAYATTIELSEIQTLKDIEIHPATEETITAHTYETTQSTISVKGATDSQTTAKEVLSSHDLHEITTLLPNGKETTTSMKGEQGINESSLSYETSTQKELEVQPDIKETVSGQDLAGTTTPTIVDKQTESDFEIKEATKEPMTTINLHETPSINVDKEIEIQSVTKEPVSTYYDSYKTTQAATEKETDFETVTKEMTYVPHENKTPSSVTPEGTFEKTETENGIQIIVEGSTPKYNEYETTVSEILEEQIHGVKEETPSDAIDKTITTVVPVNIVETSSAKSPDSSSETPAMIVEDSTGEVTTMDTKLSGTAEETDKSTEPADKFSETTPYYIELQEHTHQAIDTLSSNIPNAEVPNVTTEHYGSFGEPERGDQPLEIPSKYDDENMSPTIHTEGDSLITKEENPSTTPSYLSEQGISVKDKISTESTSETPKEDEKYVAPLDQKEKLTTLIIEQEVYTEKYNPSESDKAQKPETITETLPVEEFSMTTPLPITTIAVADTTSAEILPIEEFSKPTSLPTPTKAVAETTIHSDELNTYSKPEEKPTETTTSTEIFKPDTNEPTSDDLPSPDFSPSGPGGYGQEPDYSDSEDQAFGPGTCRYGGKVYVSAQQIPRDDPCDFCFCFRSDIICLQQSCPPPIHGCHEEPIQGFCCPRYECPVSMATTLNVTTTTTTTTTTLPPHFLPHAYKGAAHRRGCQIKGHTYKVGEVVRASSGPCLHCTCGGDGQMKCDPKACTPEPMLRQMIAAAVSSKRRR